MSVSVSDARSFLARRERSRREAGLARAAALRKKLPAAADILRRRFGASRVRLFGSLATDAPGPFCDVDLATEGLDSMRFFEALSELMGVFGGPVDLVRLEEVGGSLRERIEAEGEEL